MRRLYILLLLCLVSCVTISERKTEGRELSFDERTELYALLKKEITATSAHHLKECNCMKAFYRDFFDTPTDTARYEFDDKVGEHGALLANDNNVVSVLAIGSGMLLNELSALANVLAHRKNLKIYLNDWAYLFYDTPNFEEKALALGNNPDTIPEPLRDYYFWSWAKDDQEKFLSFFRKHHAAIDEFKTIIQKLDEYYGTRSTIQIIKPSAQVPLVLPHIDLIITVDAFIDLPNLIGALMYQLKLTNNPIRFIALNKNRPHGGFFGSSDKSRNEALSKQPVNVEIYDVTSFEKEGSYYLIQKKSFAPTSWQLKGAIDFEKYPDKDPTQSPLDEKPKL